MWVIRKLGSSLQFGVDGGSSLRGDLGLGDALSYPLVHPRLNGVIQEEIAIVFGADRALIMVDCKEGSWTRAR